MSITRVTEDASFWWSRGGGQSSHHGGSGMAGNQYPGAQLQALAGFQHQKMPVVKGDAHYFGQQSVGPEMVQLPLSRPRLRWSKELHGKFVRAVNQLGGACNATPKTIWNIMQVQGLTLFQIKSHLQKYRLGQIPKRLILRRDVVPANGRRNIADELNESINTDGYQVSSAISDMNRYAIFDAQNFGNLNHLGESQVTSVEHSEMTENRPPSTAVNGGDPRSFAEWYELLDGDFSGVKPIAPTHLNSSMDDFLNSLGYSSELAFTGTRDSSRSSMMFGSFFDEVARFPKNIEDDVMMDSNVVPMDAPIYVNY